MGHFFVLSVSLHGKLAIVQIRVESTLCQEGFMVALFDDIAVFHY